MNMNLTPDPFLPTGFTDPAELSGMPPSTPILVAYSGGADSTALLHMLAYYGRIHNSTIYAAHVHHGIRGEEADRDEAFCRETASRLSVKLFVLHADVPGLSKESGESIETCARRVRYDFFDALMEKYQIPILATAHNAGDNLETMLFNMIRGCGLSGICGIPLSRLCENGTVVRPILGMTRDEILSYCEKNALEFVTDSTNDGTEYTRNKIRAEIIPLLNEINSSAVKNSAKLAQNLRADYLCLESMTNLFLEEMRKGYALEVEKINGSPAAIVNRALASLYHEYSGGHSLEYSHVTAIRELAKKAVPHSRVTLPNRIEAVIEQGCVIFRDTPQKADILPYRIPLKEGENMISQTGCEIIMKTSQNAKNIYKNSILLSIDSAKINGNLYVRNREAGDRILMGGMHKSIKKLLCDKKIPLSLRARLPVLCDDSGILAIPLIGVRDGTASHNPQASPMMLSFIFNFNE